MKVICPHPRVGSDEAHRMPLPSQPHPRLRWLCFIALAWAVLVLQAGGFTTSIQAGMAFLDWPLSNGSINPPGWLTEIDKFAEHSHRLAAAGLGLLIVAIAITHRLRESRPLVRLGSYLLFGLVLLQGALGGLRVLLDKLNIGGDGNLKAVSFAVAHAVNAQLTIGLLAVITLAHTRTWQNSTTSALLTERRRGLIAVGLVFFVILIGAVMRQNHLTSWVSSGFSEKIFLPEGDGVGWFVNLLHRSGALLAGLFILIFAWSGTRPLRRGLTLSSLLLAQISLGILSIQLPLNPHVRTIHLVFGAALFSTLCVQVALAHRQVGRLSET